MVLAKGNNGRWLRKYRIFFLIGLTILAFQFFLAARFLAINNNTTAEGDDLQSPSQMSIKESAITENNNIPRHNKSKQNVSILRLSELNFKPECEIVGKEAVSAIHRARTQRCKQILANVTCLSLSGSLYPKHLKNDCPNDGKAPGKALGCFKDESNYRILSGYFGVNKKENSPEYCMQLCLQSGFPYAGVQYSNECFCGNEEPAMTAKLPDSSCNMKCPGNSYATCGGYYTINIYQTGIKKFFAQIANDELSQSGNNNNKSTKIVFLLTLNGRALRQVKRLLKILYNEKHYYYIHVDVREDYLFRELLSLEKRFNNIRLTRRRFATIWGGASLLEMLLGCMNELLEMSSVWHWDFVLNLSESDYPVKMVSSLEEFLSANRGRNFVKSHGRDTQRFLQKQGLDKTFVECDMRMWRVSDRKLPKGIQMDGGSDWIALSRPFVDYVAAAEPDELVAGLKQVFKYTLLPAESFFHTVLRNSRYCSTYVDNNLHVTNWKRKLGCKCQYKHVVDWCGCSPNDFRPEDWTRIQTTQPRQLFFARKFEPIVNQAVILKLELWLHGLERPSKDVVHLDSYWQSVYNHLDLSPAPDDGLLSAVNAVSRHWCNSHRSNHSECAVSLFKTVQATSYHHRDEYQYTLVRFKAEVAASLLDLEVAFKPKETLYKVTPSSLARRLISLSVSTDYDQKEQISRNFARVLSPYSDPVAVYRFSSTLDAGSVTNASLLWVDPAGSLMEIGEISLDDTAVIGYSKSGLKQPHLPGSWRLKMVHKGVSVAELVFLVIPLEFYGGVALSKSQALLMHGGSKKQPLDGFSRILDGGGVKNRLSENSGKTGDQLRDWIDELFSQFYLVDKVCAVSGEMKDLCGTRIGPCGETNWSSFAPDPKSAIGSVNKTTGGFDVW